MLEGSSKTGCSMQQEQREQQQWYSLRGERIGLCLDAHAPARVRIGGGLGAVLKGAHPVAVGSHGKGSNGSSSKSHCYGGILQGLDHDSVVASPLNFPWLVKGEGGHSSRSA